MDAFSTNALRRIKLKTNLILQKVAFLHGLIDPSWIDGNPGQPGPGPIFRTSMSDLVVAELLRDISVNLHDRTLATNVHNIGKELVTSSSQGLTAGWEDGDDICPPWFKGGPRPHSEVSLTSPRPEPWLQHVTPAMNDIVLAHALRELASITSSEKASNGIRQAGETIVKAASSKLFDEYCGTPVKVHVPGSTPKKTASAA